MKTRLLGARVGLAISFALPTFAQQTNTPDPAIAQQRDLLGDVKALDEFGVLATLHGGRGFGDFGGGIFRSAVYREEVCRVVPAMACDQLYQAARSAECYR